MKIFTLKPTYRLYIKTAIITDSLDMQRNVYFSVSLLLFFKSQTFPLYVIKLHVFLYLE